MDKKIWDILFQDLNTISDDDWTAFVADFDSKYTGLEPIYESEFKTRTPIQQQEKFEVGKTSQLIVAA